MKAMEKLNLNNYYIKVWKLYISHQYSLCNWLQACRTSPA